jgi:hypothetical protein
MMSASPEQSAQPPSPTASLPSATSASDSWTFDTASTSTSLGVPNETLGNATVVTFPQALRTKAADVFSSLGGPKQYLVKTWGHRAQDFADALFHQLPLLPQVLYTMPKEMPTVAESERASKPCLPVHVGALAFEEDCSLKGPPTITTALALIDEYLVDGFVTSTEALLVQQLRQPQALAAPWKQPGQMLDLTPFSLGYIKGQARACTLLALLSLVIEADLNLSDVGKASLLS